MTAFQSYSQAGQDLFVWEIYQHRTDGVFLDIGSGHAIEYNNTWGLEQMGWGGRLFDKHHYRDDPSCANVNRSRSLMIVGDAIETILKQSIDLRHIDYLSLDIDGDSARALQVLLCLKIRFGVITIEHDWYACGPALRDVERELLERAGYDLVCADVSWGLGPFEDWWADPQWIPKEQRDKFRCRRRWWRDIPHIADSLA
jgi:hypothetical protein